MSLRLPFFIARRYFFSKKKKNFINVISIISMIVVATGTMALIVALSVFNGLEGLLRNLYGTVDPDIVVVPSQGKSFSLDSGQLEDIRSLSKKAIVAEVIEDNALVRYNDAQRVVTLKGVSANFMDQGRIGNSIVQGEGLLKRGDISYSLIGRGIQYDLSINPSNNFYTLQIFYPQKNLSINSLNPERMLNTRAILPGGVFAIEKYYDENFVIVPIEFTEELFSYQNMRTSLEIKFLTDEIDSKKYLDNLRNILGENFKVRTADEIHGDIYKILSLEKLVVFLVFSIIIAIASINIFFSLSMLVIDKKSDVAVLSALGADPVLIRNIFLFEGGIVAFSGAFVGLTLGLVISFAQQELGFVSMGVDTAIMQAYPVQVEWMDSLYTALFFVIVTVASAIQPANEAARRFSHELIQ